MRFMDRTALDSLAEQAGLRIERIGSFPLPRLFGRWFVYNETVTTARIA